MSDESIWRAVHRLEAAAQQASSAAASMEETKRQLEFLFADGYGGNALKLIELLENHPPINIGVDLGTKDDTVYYTRCSKGEATLVVNNFCHYTCPNCKG